MKKTLTNDSNLIKYPRLSIFYPKCAYSRYNLPCWNQSRRAFLCPLEDKRFSRLLDFYFDGTRPDDIPGVVDPRAIPHLKAIEIAVWFDDDFFGLDAYGVYKLTGKIPMTKRLCMEFRKAWCRYYARLKPTDVRVPKWFKGYSRWLGISIGYQKKFLDYFDERKQPTIRREPRTGIQV